ncbi:inositol-3-phosphate synthase [Halomarina halobia]|uniref:Inositol-3-phosphate synthase n=1 Tax=Halomarina halobia TaxID=3033386 RepID=A0ABD6ADT7_9EURY|nr:inositol-3-phosphate synthase [Halomarina sp. PSR21]
MSASAETGVWFVGARGNIATTAMVGARAIADGRTSTTGLVTEREPCSRLTLVDVDSLAFGGHDVRSGSVPDAAVRLAERSGIASRDVIEAVEDDLAAVEDDICRGTTLNCGAVSELADQRPLEADRTVEEVVERLREDLRGFRRDHGLERVVVVNVASTEPMLSDPDRYDSRAAFERAVAENDRDLPASALYAYAALVEGCPYANFTPGIGSAVGGLRELAEEEGVPHMGNDGKTGESLVKAALAPMFAGRNLRVRSWEGHNILGNTDGLVLEDEANEAGKLASKGGILDGILPDIEHNRVRIDYAPSLGDRKTAWDDVRFEGFLDTRMKMQFTWEGADSALAAPLVLDLVRLLAHADGHGEGGLQPHLASFFKAPIAVGEHALTRQFGLLYDYVDRHAATVLPERPSGVSIDD